MLHELLLHRLFSTFCNEEILSRHNYYNSVLLERFDQINCYLSEQTEHLNKGEWLAAFLPAVGLVL